MATSEEKAEIVSKDSASKVLRISDILIQPRLSEKAVALGKQDQYVFTIKKDANKLEVRKALEKFYGIKVARVNMIKVQGKIRRYGRSTGKTSSFKKAIVTLKKDSKRPEIMEAA